MIHHGMVPEKVQNQHKTNVKRLDQVPSPTHATRWRDRIIQNTFSSVDKEAQKYGNLPASSSFLFDS